MEEEEPEIHEMPSLRMEPAHIYIHSQGLAVDAGWSRRRLRRRGAAGKWNRKLSVCNACLWRTF